MHMECSHMQSARDYSDDLIAQLRGALAQIALGDDVVVVVVGSLARREASSQSDLDYFVVHQGDVAPEGIFDSINEAISALGLRPPSSSGAFAISVSQDKFLSTIGGTEESNAELTRRMLFLLESDWIVGESEYESLMNSVIQRYIRDKITQHQLARFFLNDLIRYYRTICVDFEYKTADGGKSWGDRNIKLMFSRKLLYFSGVLAAAETAQSACDFKRSELTRLLRLTPIDRVVDVCGVDAARLLKRYDKFIGWMADGDVRDLLKGTTAEREDQSDKFREMKNAGHHFSWELESLLHRRYAPTHSIYQALLL